METVDELVPLTPEDIQKLEANRHSSYRGCAVPLFIIFAVAGYFALSYYGVSYLWLILLAVVSILFLAGGLLFLFYGSFENKEVILDIQEGKKRRIVAPIDRKEIVEIAPRRKSVSTGAQMARSAVPLKFKYFMTVKDWKFDLTEEQYLAGARKGAFVEFFVAPHSKTILSFPIEVRE